MYFFQISKSWKSKSGHFFNGIMCSEKFPKVLKNDFKVLVKFFRKCQQFFTGTFLMTKCPKSRRIWGMSRDVGIFLFHFLRSKIDFFKVLQTFRGWFLSGLDGLRGVLSTLKPFYHTTHWFWEKSIFWSKNDTFWLQSVCQVGVKNAFFESKNRFFQNSSNFQGIVPIGFGRV